MTVVLETRNLVKKFGAFAATNDVSLKVERGARQALIGPNGAGKTSLFHLHQRCVHRAERGAHRAARRPGHHGARPSTNAPNRGIVPHVPDQPACSST